MSQCFHHSAIVHQLLQTCRCSGSSWVSSHGVLDDSPTATHDYIFSLYWASATLTSVGYGDVSAHNVREMVFALVVQLIGIMLYGYCLGVIAATLTNTASFRYCIYTPLHINKTASAWYVCDVSGYHLRRKCKSSISLCLKTS